MRDSSLALLAERYKKASAAVDAANKEKAELKAKLLEEMERRGTTGIITGGLKITYVKATYVEYDQKRLRKLLGTKYKLATRQVFDATKLSAAVQEGEIELEKVERCSIVKERAPYVLVNAAAE